MTMVALRGSPGETFQPLAWAAAGCVGGFVAALVDTAFTGARGPWVPLVLVVAAGVLGLLGTVHGLVLGAAWNAMRGHWQRWGLGPWGVDAVIVGSAASLLLAMFVFAAGTIVFTERTPARHMHAFAWLLVAATIGACVAARVIRSLVSKSRVVSVLLVALVSLVATRFALSIAVDVDLRFAWVWGAGVFATVAVLRRLPTRRAALATLLVLAGSVGATLGILDRYLVVRVTIARYSPTLGVTTRLVARTMDFDADGYTFVDGDGDCAPLDGTVHPFGTDIPDDGIDQDCHAGDLSHDALPPEPETSAERPGKRSRPNVLLITVDSLRADHVGLYGYHRDTTPRLDATFGEAIRFDRAYTIAPVTDRTLPSILTAIRPSRLVETLDYDTHVLARRRVLLTERLRAAGYHTVVLQSFHFFDDHGLDQGIDDLVVLHDVRSTGAKSTTRQAIEQLRAHVDGRSDKPLFMWVHYYEPHARYTPPAEHRLWDGGGEFDDEAPIDLYDGEIHYVDAEIGRLFDEATSLGLMSDALVLLSADHGEEFLEHGRRMHAAAVYEESIRVPLLVKGADLVARDVDAPFTLLDLTPTLLELLDIPFVGGVDGISQLELWRGGESHRRDLIVEQYKHGTDELQKLAIVEGSDKMILDIQNSLWEQYDLGTDAAERHNIYGSDVAKTSRLRGRLLDYLAVARVLARGATTSP